MNVAMMLKPKEVITYLNADDTLSKGLEMMKEHGYTAVPVITEDGLYAGSVSEGDFLWTTLEHDSEEYEKIHLGDIIRDGFIKPVSIVADMHELLHMIMAQNYVPVIDSRECFVGIVTRKDIISYFYNLTQDDN